MKTYLQAGAFALGILILFAVSIYVYMNEGETPPCAKGGSAVKCYSVTQKMCEKSISMGEASCKEWIKKMSLPPGRLTGPIQQRCVESFLDQTFSVSRKGTAECHDYFRELASWRQRNQPPN